MACGRLCNDDWDVRCCCEPNCPTKNSMKQFNKCKQKIGTLYFALFNDYSTYKYIESCNGCVKKNDIRLACDMLGRGIKLSKKECVELVELISDRDDE